MLLPPSPPHCAPVHVCCQVLRTVTKDTQTGHELAVNEFTTFILGTCTCVYAATDDPMLLLLVDTVTISQPANGSPPCPLDVLHRTNNSTASCAFTLCTQQVDLRESSRPCQGRQQPQQQTIHRTDHLMQCGRCPQPPTRRHCTGEKGGKAGGWLDG